MKRLEMYALVFFSIISSIGMIYAFVSNHTIGIFAFMISTFVFTTGALILKVIFELEEKRK